MDEWTLESLSCEDAKRILQGKETSSLSNNAVYVLAKMCSQNCPLDFFACLNSMVIILLVISYKLLSVIYHKLYVYCVW